MLTKRNVVAVFGLCWLVACSPPPPDAEREQEAASDYEVQEAGDDGVGVVDDPDQAMLEAGWRWGSLAISLDLHQRGDKQQTEAGTRSDIEWESHIQAESRQQVLVAPDLRVLVPEDGDEESRHSAFKSAPYFVSDKSAPAVVSGSASHRERSRFLSPDSNEATSISQSLDMTGEVSEFVLTDMHPSLYGEGHDAWLELRLATHRVRVETAEFRDLPPAVSRSETDKEESLRFMLHPAPEAELRDYPFWEPQTPAELIESERKRHLETLSLLKQIQAEAVPLSDGIRAGLITRAEKDSLVLTYEYTGAKQLPLLAGLEGLAVPPSPNLLRISIELKVDP